MPSLRRSSCLLALAALPLLAACGSDDDPAASERASAPRFAAYSAPQTDDAPAAEAPAGGEVVVRMAASQFGPAQATAAVGQTIRWANDDAVAHTVTATNGADFDSGTVEGGGEFAFTASDTGRISYLCAFHPGMTGTIVVR